MFLGGRHIGITVQLCGGQELVWQSWSMGMWWVGGLVTFKWLWAVWLLLNCCGG